MNPELKTPTSVGMETVDETVARAKKMAQPTVSANELANQTATVNPPVPQVGTNDTSRTSGLVGNVVNNTQSFIQAQSEEAAKARELATLMGSQTFDGSAQRQQLNEQFNQPANLARLTDIQTQLAKRNEQTELQKAVATSGGAGSLQAERALTLADKQAAIRDAGLAAEAAVLQGNIETATTLINQAMSDYYQDRQLNNQNMINQLNYYSGIAEGQTKQLLDQEKRKYEEDQLNIQNAQAAVSTAVESGFASQDEIDTMTSLSGDPAAQKTYAQKIIARARAQKIAEERTLLNLQMQKLRQDLAASGQGTTPTAEQYQVKTMKNEEMLRHLNILNSNPETIKLLSTGGSLESLGQALKTAGTTAAVTGPVGLIGGPVGLAIGGSAGFLTGLGGSFYAQNKAKEDLLASVDFLLNSSAFQSIRDEKAAGVTFGQLSNEERQAAAKAANALIASTLTDNGISTGFRGNPETVMKNIEIFTNAVKTNQDRLNNSILPKEISSEIESVYNE